MKAPSFWYGTDSLPATILAPIGAVYGWAGRCRRRRAAPFVAPIPVMCIGNLVAGGSGKTPIALDLLHRLRQHGHNVHAVSRGYRGSLPRKGKLPIAVDPQIHTAAEVGDEPLLLASVAPTWVCPNRPAAARAAAAAGADAVILDDGYQNPWLHYDLSVLAIDGRRGLGNGRLIPAGPLRERVQDGLERADAVVIVGVDRHGIADGLASNYTGLVHSACLEPDVEPGVWDGRRFVAFAGIADPERFFESVRQVGGLVVDQVAFQDHHDFSSNDLADLVTRAHDNEATLITTAKDHIRLPIEYRATVSSLPVRVRWTPDGAADDFGPPSV